MALSLGSETYWLQGDIDSDLTLIRPIELRVERDEFGDYIASEDQLAVFGVGADKESAIRDYVASLTEYYRLSSPSHKIIIQRQGYFADLDCLLPKLASNLENVSRPLEVKEVERQLKRKFGFEQANDHSGDHRWYRLQLDGLPVILMRFSHGQRGSLSAKIQSAIARQLRVPNGFLRV